MYWCLDSLCTLSRLGFREFRWFPSVLCTSTWGPRSLMYLNIGPYVAQHRPYVAQHRPHVAQHRPHVAQHAIWNPFWTHFWRPKGPLRHEKPLKSFVLWLKIKVLQFSVRVASRARLGTLLGSILGAFWVPDGSNMASRALKTAPRRPREPPRRILYAARIAPRPPKTLPGLPPARPRRLQGSKTAQGASKTPPREMGREVLGAPSRFQVPCRRLFAA